MLDSCLFESRPDSDRHDRRKKPLTLAMSTLVHVVIAGALILIPLFQTQAVPPVTLPPPMVSPGPPVRIIRLASTPASNRSAAPRPVAPILSNAVIEPIVIPEKIAYIEDAIDIGAMNNLRPGPSTGPIGGNGPVGSVGFPFSTFRPDVAAPPALPPDPPTPPPAPKFQVKAPIRVSSTLQKSLLVKQVEPIYPRLAKIAHIEGTVIVEARITQAGTIDSLRIISGNPLLTQSVIDAVQQWRYQPTVLNGELIDVITTITVNFRLN